MTVGIIRFSVFFYWLDTSVPKFPPHTEPFKSRAGHFFVPTRFNQPWRLNGLSWRVREGIIGSVILRHIFRDRSRAPATSLWCKFKEGAGNIFAIRSRINCGLPLEITTDFILKFYLCLTTRDRSLLWHTLLRDRLYSLYPIEASGLLSKYLPIVELHFDVILCYKLGNKNSDVDHIKCSRGPHLARGMQIPHPYFKEKTVFRSG